MSAITEQDVLRAFYKFDCRKLPVLDVNGTFMPGMDVAMRKRLCAAWMKAFDWVEADVFKAAVDLVLQNAKKYPTEDEMYEFIVLAEKKLDEPEPQEPLKPEPSADEIRRKRIMAMVAAAKSGDYKTALKYAASGAAEKEFAEFAKTTWPEATAEWLADNRAEIESLLKQEKQCGKCGSLHRCRTKGFKLCWQLGEQGQLVTVMKPCFMRKAGANENVQ